ncbi:hypothetical protein J3459_008143 [Metarhizium acridum]|nr:hypothetical protein J3459_008143 [Metarhizium acridum]
MVGQKSMTHTNVPNTCWPPFFCSKGEKKEDEKFALSRLRLHVCDATCCHSPTPATANRYVERFGFVCLGICHSAKESLSDNNRRAMVRKKRANSPLISSSLSFS